MREGGGRQDPLRLAVDIYGFEGYTQNRWHQN